MAQVCATTSSSGGVQLYQWSPKIRLASLLISFIHTRGGTCISRIQNVRYFSVFDSSIRLTSLCRSTPLPPVSRLEETTQVRRCLRLRRAVSEGLSLVLDRYIQAQHTIGLLTDPSNLEKYYDIYEISMAELAEARSASSETTGEDQYSLKWLRIVFSRLYTMRQSILCCLLALNADGSGSDIPPWTCAVEEMRELATVTHEAANKIANILNEKDSEYNSFVSSIVFWSDSDLMQDPSHLFPLYPLHPQVVIPFEHKQDA